MRWVFALAVLTGCGRLGFDATDASSGSSDGGPTGFGPWGTPTPLAALDGTFDEITASFSADGLELWFASDRGGDGYLLFRTTRVAGGEFGAPDLVAVNATEATEPALAKDGLSVYMATGASYLAKATRATSASAWSDPLAVSELDGYVGEDLGVNDSHIVLTNMEDGLIYEGTRPSTTGDAWTLRQLDELTLGEHPGFPCLSEDGLEMMFQQDIEGGESLFRTSRASIDDPWGPIDQLDFGIPDAVSEDDCELSHDGRELVFNARRPGSGADLYIVTREPL